MSSEKERLHEEYERMRLRRTTFEKLVTSQEWKEYRNAVESLIMTNQNQIMTQPATLDGAFETATLKGKLRGLIEALDHPLSLIQSYLIEEQRLLTQQEEVEPSEEQPNG